MLHSLTEVGLDSLGGAPFLAARRHEALEAAALLGAPSKRDEVWRYSPIDQLELDRYTLAQSGDVAVPQAVTIVLEAIGDAAAVVVVRNGHVLSVERFDNAAGVSVGTSEDVPQAESLLGSVQHGGDLLVRLNDAYQPDVVVVDVAASVHVALPIVIVQVIDAADEPTVSFPRTVIHLGQNAQAAVIEVFIGRDGDDALVVPVSETIVDNQARLDQISVQLLGNSAWFIARQAATVERDATLRAFAVGLGGAYDRTRSDVALIGQGASSQQRSVYFGSNEQVHDIRTLQDHVAARTQSNLLCKGAVADRSRSIYSGLIRVQHGAVRSDATQTNHNLVLGEGAHADSVPNLDILENDVTCSHASTVGPIDEDQRYYLESRGIAPAAAERLIVTGFFDDVILAIPAAGLASYLSDVIHARLSATDLGGTRG